MYFNHDYSSIFCKTLLNCPQNSTFNYVLRKHRQSSMKTSQVITANKSHPKTQHQTHIRDFHNSLSNSNFASFQTSPQSFRHKAQQNLDNFSRHLIIKVILVIVWLYPVMFYTNAPQRFQTSLFLPMNQTLESLKLKKKLFQLVSRKRRQTSFISSRNKNTFFLCFFTALFHPSFPPRSQKTTSSLSRK